MRILRLKQVEALVGLCRATIYQRKREGTFPQTVKLGARAVGWIADDVLAWIAQQANRPAPSPGHPSEERSHFHGDVKCEAASKRHEGRIDEGPLHLAHRSKLLRSPESRYLQKVLAARGSQ